ncbi:hypothetical protein K456DRAFT_1743495 [Colletotrichum gloeosporioides 23]|nr:hypothetical protein K456DRAFT_1743495 [Colletotrichum gloeosporioides 23]
MPAVRIPFWSFPFCLQCAGRKARTSSFPFRVPCHYCLLHPRPPQKSLQFCLESALLVDLASISGSNTPDSPPKTNLDDTPSHPKSILKQPSKPNLSAAGTPSQESSLKLSSSKASIDDKLLLRKPLISNLSPIQTPKPAPVWVRTALCSTPPTSRGPK